MSTIHHKPVLQVYMPEVGVIHAWVAGSPEVKTFRDHPPLPRTPSPFRQMHDALNVMHHHELEAAQIVTVFPNQRDHEAVLRLMDSPVGAVPANYGHPRVRPRPPARNRNRIRRSPIVLIRRMGEPVEAPSEAETDPPVPSRARRTFSIGAMRAGDLRPAAH